MSTQTKINENKAFFAFVTDIEKCSIDFIITTRNEGKFLPSENIRAIEKLGLNLLMRPAYELANLEKALVLRDELQGAFINYLANIVPKKMIARLLGISSHSLSKQFKRNEISKGKSEVIIGFLQIWSELMILFKNDNELVVSWLNEPLAPLSGYAPMDLMDTGAGRYSIMETIVRMKYGDFS